MHVYLWMHAVYLRAQTYMYTCISKQEVNLVFFFSESTLCFEMGSCTGPCRATKLGWPVSLRELSVAVSLAHWLHSAPLHAWYLYGFWGIESKAPCLCSRLLTNWAILLAQGWLLSLREASMSPSTCGSRYSPWNITGYLNGWVQDFISSSSLTGF